MPTIQTFVFFDLEATGVPEKENNETKIISVGLLATTRDAILNAQLGDTPDYKKLILHVNPKRPMTEEAVILTGLNNADLEKYEDFKSVFPQILSFLSELEQPACLIAHSGEKFDFRLLLTECKEADVAMPSIYCADSFHILRGLNWGICFNSLRNSLPSYHSCRTERIIEWERRLKLTELYKRYVNKYPENAHNAEGDCIMLLRIAVSLKKLFVSRTDIQAKRLTEISVLRRPNVPT